MRLEGPSEAIMEAFPEALREVAWLFTELGSAEAAVLILAILFWLTHRHETALVVSYALLGGFIVLALKTYLQLPRPPEELALIEGARDDPYGFPSGHAFFSVVLYGGVLVAFDALDRRDLVAGVVALVTLISLTRVALGVHYLGDIIVGGALGVAVLAAAHHAVAGKLRRGFAIATALGVITLVLSAGTLGIQPLADDIVPELWLILGFAIGGLLTAGWVEHIPPLRSRVEGAVVTALGLVWVGALMALGEVVAPDGGPVAALLGALLLGGVILAPALVGRLEVPVLAGTDQLLEGDDHSERE